MIVATSGHIDHGKTLLVRTLTGVDTDRLYQLLYQNERAERVALQTRAMQSLESGG